MQPFRAPSAGAPGTGARVPSRPGVQELRKPSGSQGRRIVSQGLARGPLRAPDVSNEAPAGLQVDTTSFEEWMKMATDNKINVNNTWSFALIDYFHDMSLLRSDSGDGSINFQKASCTLDGCVKVWTSRVDSVMAETGRLLSGLQDEDTASPPEANPGDVSQASVDAADDSGDEGRGSARRRRAKAREATLAKSFAQLQVKRFDLEFAVDPLFKKTSADFDEGGAGGLLMNHLHADRHLKVVFDASDVTAVEAAEAEAPPDAADAPSNAASPAPMDLERLRARLYAAAGYASPDDVPLSDLLAQRSLCPATANFSFAEGNDGGLPSVQDPPPGDAYPAMDMDMDLDTDMDVGAIDGDDGASGQLDFFQLDGVGVGERDFDVALAHDNALGAAPLQEEEHERLFSYFDHRLKKNWAGPEHWKMTRLQATSQRAGSAAPGEIEGSAASAARPRARRKEAEVISFVNAAPGPSAKELFAPSATPSSLLLSKAAQTSKARHLLPEDHHFNSKRLMRLFLKPKATIMLQRRAPASAPHASWSSGVDGSGLDAGAEGDMGALFHNDDPYDDVLPPALDEPSEVHGAVLDDSDGEDDIFSSEAVRRVRPDFVDHARRAKQVDVKKLKDNLWKSLDLHDQAPQTVDVALQALEPLYSRAQYDEISTSFCFICLLHLANEEGLQLSVQGAPPGAGGGRTVLTTSADDDALGAPLPEDEGHVGRLGALIAQRDPLASPAA